MYAFGEHRFSSSFMGFLVGLYISIHLPPPTLFFIIQSHTFAAENCAIGNSKIKNGKYCQYSYTFDFFSFRFFRLTMKKKQKIFFFVYDWKYAFSNRTGYKLV